MIKILLVMLLFGTGAPALAEEVRSLRPVRLSSQVTEKSVERIEARPGAAPEDADDYATTLVAAPLMLAFFYALVSSSVRPGVAT